MLIVRGEAGGRPGVDVRLAGGRVAEVGPRLRPRPDEDVVDAAGGAVIPALHDHHVHLKATAAALASVVVDHRGLAAALHDATPGRPGDWARVVGYHESVAGDLDRHALDALAPDRLVRVQHRSGGLWVLNTRALDAVGASGAQEPGIERDEHGAPTGRLWRLDGWLAGRVPPTPVDLATVARRAADHGIAGFTDADPHRSRADVDLLAGSGLPQSVVLMSADDLGLPPGDPRFAAGPRKVLLDDATLPPIGELAARFAEAHAAGRTVAVHCVTRLQLVATLAALADAGPAPHPGDRIEHGGVVPAELRAELRRLGVTVVTQPHFVAERGDQYRTDVDPDDLPLLYPCASLLAAGVRVAAGTDAPFGGPDPWAAMAAAVHRRTPTGHVLGAAERVDPARALDLFLGAADDPATPRRLDPGSPADLCVLDRPLAEVHRALGSGTPGLDPVVLTVARGGVIADHR